MGTLTITHQTNVNEIDAFLCENGLGETFEFDLYEDSNGNEVYMIYTIDTNVTVVYLRPGESVTTEELLYFGKIYA